MLTDLKFALRQLLHTPGWTVAVVGILGLGLGLALATFMLVDAVLLRPPAIDQWRRVVSIGATDAQHSMLMSSSYPAFLEYEKQATGFDGIAAYGYASELHWRQVDGSRQRLSAALVSGGYFATLGVDMQLGRSIAADDDRANGAPVAVISARLWQRAFGSAADAIGQTLTLNATRVTVIGVAADSFHGLGSGAGPDLWLPLAQAPTIAPGAAPDHPESQWSWHWLQIVGRMKPGVDLAQAQAQIETIAGHRSRAVTQGDKELRARVVPVFPNAQNEAMQRGAGLLMLSAALVLLVVGANVAGLLLARGERRRGDFVLRAALGASRNQLARLVVTECVLLVVAGTALAAGFAQAVVRRVVELGAASDVIGAATESLPATSRVLLAAALLAALMVGLAGVWPALKPRSISLSSAISGSSGARATRSSRTGQRLIGVQFAATVVLLFAAGLVARTVHNLWAIDIGVPASNSLVMALDLSPEHSGRQASVAAVDRLLAAIAAPAGGEHAAVGSMVPISEQALGTELGLPDRADGKSDQIAVAYNPVSRGFFAALGTQLLAGRDFVAADNADAPRVAIVSRSMAEKYWPGSSALGRTIVLGGDPVAPPARIVGVAPDIRFDAVNSPAGEMLYVPLAQRQFGDRLQLLVRPGDGGSAVASMRMIEAFRALEPERAPAGIATIADRVSRSIAEPRFLATVFGGFALLALLLAACGVYASFAYSVATRRRELGLRLALGASSRSVFRLILRDSLRIVAPGVAVGALAALFAGDCLRATLVGVSSSDPSLLIAVSVTLAAVALLASALPAREAAMIDPQQALRSE